MTLTSCPTSCAQKKTRSRSRPVIVSRTREPERLRTRKTSANVTRSKLARAISFSCPPAGIERQLAACARGPAIISHKRVHDDIGSAITKKITKFPTRRWRGKRGERGIRSSVFFPSGVAIGLSTDNDHVFLFLFLLPACIRRLTYLYCHFPLSFLFILNKHHRKASTYRFLISTPYLF